MHLIYAGQEISNISSIEYHNIAYYCYINWVSGARRHGVPVEYWVFFIVFLRYSLDIALLLPINRSVIIFGILKIVFIIPRSNIISGINNKHCTLFIRGIIKPTLDIPFCHQLCDVTHFQYLVESESHCWCF